MNGGLNITDLSGYRFFKPIRYACALCIATGGAMHLAALVKISATGHDAPFWVYAIFTAAVVLYLPAALGILKNIRSCYFIPAIAPVIGGALIFAGLLSKELDFELLIPGTLASEITPIGFITLISEPVAFGCAVFLIYHKVWRFEPGGGDA